MLAMCASGGSRFSSSYGAPEPPSAKALLHGVEWARTRGDSLTASLEIRYVSPRPFVTFKCLIEMVGNARRFEIFEGGPPAQVVLRDGDEFHSYMREQSPQVKIYTLHDSVGVWGDIAFDPRSLGLQDSMLAGSTVKSSLWPVEVETWEVHGPEAIDGATAWRVRASRKDGTTIDYWIEERLFRVHRVAIHASYTDILVDSEFDPADRESPFPRRVVTRRIDKGQDAPTERVFTVKALDFDTPIPPERFTLKSIGLPVNTMAIDYRIDRVVGYWDGEGLSKDPVYEKERPVAPTEPPARLNRLFWIGLNVVGVVLLLSLAWWMRKRGSRNS